MRLLPFVKTGVDAELKHDRLLQYEVGRIHLPQLGCGFRIHLEFEVAVRRS